jgi:hypothetical protein
MALGMIHIASFGVAIAQKEPGKKNANEPTLTHAVMCEAISDYVPIHPAVVFSIDIGKVSCFTAFDSVLERTYIYHKWYHYDKLSTKKKLFLKAPRWSTYSSIQLREADRGPWRVEITNQNGTVMAILRFSVTD